MADAWKRGAATPRPRPAPARSRRRGGCPAADRARGSPARRGASPEVWARHAPRCWRGAASRGPRPRRPTIRPATRH
ncbi:hypothetical protein D7V93_22975 [Corallococcus llansteffanensis]|uniref:Uncharacterized protein n=1 Tax=Corallococcus llansteffanensis TaxID=2316731 RepID=A0A3A8PHE2_9BACT|nr:hypothetical protein D7V93_22975 [Corallococcus llansteffanensis]